MINCDKDMWVDGTFAREKHLGWKCLNGAFYLYHLGVAFVNRGRVICVRDLMSGRLLWLSTWVETREYEVLVPIGAGTFFVGHLK